MNATPAAALPDVDEQEIVIPPFDPSVMVGIVKDIVDLACDGTSMAPQFAFLAARTIVGALMTARGVTFKDTDVDGLMIAAAIGETGSSKGWAWKRVLRIFQLAAQQLSMLNGFGAKIMDGIDSGAGLKDFFFEAPEDQPVIAYIDEIADFGDKAHPTRNPGIVTGVLELADSRSVSRTLAGKKKHKSNAYFAMYACGQDGETYMMSVPGKKKMGFFDRARPEYSQPSIAGKTPDIDPLKATHLYRILMSMIGAFQALTLDADADQAIEEFWGVQPSEIATKVRLKKHIKVDAFMSAFSRSSKTVELEDVERAIHIFNREIVIRRKCFTDELPDRGAYYLSKMKKLTDRMSRQLAAGSLPYIVARSRSDYEDFTGAYKDNDDMLFDRVWQVHVRSRLREVQIEGKNGRMYKKFLPERFED